MNSRYSLYSCSWGSSLVASPLKSNFVTLITVHFIGPRIMILTDSFYKYTYKMYLSIYIEYRNM